VTTTDEQSFLAQFDRFLTDRVGPSAAEMDRDPDVLREVFDEFKEHRGLAIRIPEAEGGCMLSDQDFATFRIQLARYGGALSFLQAQHQVAVTWLTRSPEQDSVRPLYNEILQDGLALGIGFLSPRHSALDIKREGSTYVLSGELPWVTGYGFLQQVVTSFEHDGQRHFALLPFQACTRGAGQLSYSATVPLVVFNALNTVRARLNNWSIPHDQIFLSRPVDARQEPERHNSVYTLAGACRGLQDLVNQVPNLPDGMQSEYHRLTERLDRYVESIMVAGGSPSVVRAEAAQLAHDWSALARWAHGGKALLQDHPVNRLARESWQYGVTALRPADLVAVYPSS
jgi:alkylation response protein AidB-like acyl-CoA dehydrogenase